MKIAEITYEGALRCNARHLRSGQEIVTDAPPDNQGKGEAFSPTDLMSTSLGVCMVTIMGIAARTHGMNIDGTRMKISKVMAADPRRVSEVHVEFFMPPIRYSEKEQHILEQAAINCPVAKSLHPDLKQKVLFHFQEKD
jgi:putative redox protein